MDPGDVETHRLEFVLPPNLDRRPGWGRLGPGLGPSGRRPLMGRRVVVVAFEEEEEEETLEEARLAYLCWSREAAMGQSCCWAQLPSSAAVDAAAVAAAAATAATAATVAVAAASCCESVE